MLRFLVDDTLEATREQLMELVEEEIIARELTPSDLRNWLPHQTLKQALNYSSVRLGRELGHKIINLGGWT